MSYFNPKKEFSLKDLLYKVLIFIGTVGVIVYFLPRDGKFNYQFDIDKPWKYGQLMATFDFPIYKADEVVKREQDSILSSFQPYFQLDKEVEKKVLAKLKTDYQSHLRELLPSTDYVRFLERTLSEIYRAGIVSTEELDKLHKDSISSIMVINDKMASHQPTEKVYSVKDAYHYILTADSSRYRPEVLRQCSLNEYLFPNLTYDEQRTETAREEILNDYSWANGIVLSGQKIIDRGEIVNQETYSILESLRKESIKRSESIGQKRLMLVGQILFTGIFMLCFMLYLELFRKDYYKRKGSLSLLFASITFYCVLTAIMVSNNIFNVYIIPYAMLPVIIRIFLDSRTAFTAQAITILICSICLRYPHEFILLQLSAGLVAILSLRELSQRSQLFRTAILVILTYVAVYFAFELITENDLSKFNGSMYTYFIINGILLLFAYPLLFLVEKTFGFTSNVTLVELSNINNSLLRRMSETVPGTFQHSMQMANLAAEAANRIGAKSQLVRTGALYHDIGKMENPIFFTENQSGNVNPHKNLSYEQSAQTIISHVTDGLKLAEKHNLPKAVKDFITTHHGR
uniref:HD family phosphohydrolase n=1 Tax=Prevotella heparinolytica TaxID=28113 RepID=UPI0035A0FDD8